MRDGLVRECLAEFGARTDVRALAAGFRRDGRVQVHSFLPAGFATRLRDELAASAGWTRVINAGARTFEIPAAQYLDSERGLKASLDEALYAEARDCFRYRYDVVRVPDRRPFAAAVSEMLGAFAEFIACNETLALLHAITGGERARFADAQATRYLPGDFLTRHDDEQEGASRAFAYVLSLAQDWRAEWGGLLHFLDDEGRVTGTFVPTFNCLALFRVPQPHSVSFVAPYAGAERISVTGWLRTEIPR